jgi:hypothetical protein
MAPGPAEGCGDDGDAATRKRKAEKDALVSPASVLMVGDGKRRQSPTAEERQAAAGSSGSGSGGGSAEDGCHSLLASPGGALLGAGGPAQGALHRDGAPPPPLPAIPESPEVSAEEARGSTSRLSRGGSTGSGSVAPRGPLHAVPPAMPQAAEQQQQPPPQQRRQVVVVLAGDGESAGSEDETAPVELTRLASKVRKGRQSIAPGLVRRACACGYSQRFFPFRG